MSRSLIAAPSLGALCLACIAVLGACSAPPGENPPDFWLPHGTWQEVYRDDFDGPSGSPASAASWNVMNSDLVYNDEREYYTNRPSNVMLDGSSHLVITAQNEHYVDASGVTSTQPYTSGRLDTKGLVQPRYGRIEARVKLPAGKGYWPAFWMLGQNIDTVKWPNCGEIDILELRGSHPATITGSLHEPDDPGGETLVAGYTLPAGTFADDFHVFALEWTADGMRWLVDEQPFQWRTPNGMKNINRTWIYDQPMYIILNLAVGGIFDGDPDATTQFPAQMIVDYVKVSSFVPAP